MAKAVEEEGKGARLEWRAFKSFLAYMHNLSNEEIAFLEQIFPVKMDICHGRIIRKIAPEVYPIPQETARNLLVELAKMCRYSRPNAQLTAAESLGFCWLCLACSRLRLPVNLKTIWATKATALHLDDEFPTLLVPTLFGDRKIRISHRIAKFLYALSCIPSKKSRETILQRPFRSLTRTFDIALKNAAPKPEYGNITYVSLLSPLCVGKVICLRYENRTFVHVKTIDLKCFTQKYYGWKNKWTGWKFNTKLFGRIVCSRIKHLQRSFKTKLLQFTRWILSF